jgi:adenylosuccinate lyase
MLYNFSPQKRYTLWRKLWVALAEGQRSLGINITKTQISEMRKHVADIDWDKVNRWERRLHHDVMAHIQAYASQCPKARAIIHLGATSAFVVDNTELVLIRDGLIIIKKSLIDIIHILCRLAIKYADTPTVAYTHFQPAQLTTLGKRVSLWLQDLVLDLDQLERFLEDLKFLGTKGAVGTQASFLDLFDGDHKKVEKLDRYVANAMGFKDIFTISSQTYTRKLDANLLAVLSAIAQSCHKFSNDLRLLQHLHELEEPFEQAQVGSSAMPYKRNPVKSERIASLARFIISLYPTAAVTASNQWLERTLDDSAAKRITIPEAFMATDAVLNLYRYILQGLRINMDVIRANVQRELELIATERILMEAVKKGGDRQLLHEKIRRYSLRDRGNLFNLLRSDPDFKDIKALRQNILPSAYVGRAPAQVKRYINSITSKINVKKPLSRGTKIF